MVYPTLAPHQTATPNPLSPTHIYFRSVENWIVCQVYMFCKFLFNFLFSLLLCACTCVHWSCPWALMKRSVTLEWSWRDFTLHHHRLLGYIKNMGIALSKFSSWQTGGEGGREKSSGSRRLLLDERKGNEFRKWEKTSLKRKGVMEVMEHVFSLRILFVWV